MIMGEAVLRGCSSRCLAEAGPRVNTDRNQVAGLLAPSSSLTRTPKATRCRRGGCGGQEPGGHGVLLAPQGVRVVPGRRRGPPMHFAAGDAYPGSAPWQRRDLDRHVAYPDAGWAWCLLHVSWNATRVRRGTSPCRSSRRVASLPGRLRERLRAVNRPRPVRVGDTRVRCASMASWRWRARRCSPCT